MRVRSCGCRDTEDLTMLYARLSAIYPLNVLRIRDKYLPCRIIIHGLSASFYARRVAPFIIHPLPIFSLFLFFFFFFSQSRDTVMFRVFYYNLESCYLYSQVFGKGRLLGSPLSDRKILNTIVLKLTSSIQGIAGLWNRWCREICHSWLIDLWMQNLCVARSRNL